MTDSDPDLPESEQDAAPSAAELEAAGQNSMFGDAPAAPAPAVEVARLVLPPAAELRALDELIELGFLRGILARLAEIERMDPVHAEFVRVQRELARQFQFDAMREILCRKDLPES